MKKISILTNTWKIENIKGILFDKDGTLLNSHFYWGEIIKRRANALINTYSLKPELFSDICTSMGLNIANNHLLPQGPIALVNREKVIDSILKFFYSQDIKLNYNEVEDIFKSEQKKFTNQAENFIQILPGVESLFKELKTYDVKISIVTSDTVANTEVFVNKYKLNSYVDLIVGKDSVNSPKVTGIPATFAINKLGLNSNNVICAGDAPMDLIMAKNSNTKGIGLTTGQVQLENLQQHTLYTANSLTELKVIME